MTNLDKLTEKDGGLRKEQNGVTLGIDKGKNTGITIVKHDPQMVLSVQLDRAETAKLMAYLGGKDLLCDSIKQYEAMNEASLERMEELRGTIRELTEIIKESCEHLEKNKRKYKHVKDTVHFDGIDGHIQKVLAKSYLSLDKARKQLEG